MSAVRNDVASVAWRPAKRPWKRTQIAACLLGASVVLSGVCGLIVLSERAAAKQQCINNLKQLGLAFHEYASEHGRFPAAAMVGSDGKSLLSWRVALLPYLGRRDLYEQFRRDEPWDSPHNLALVAKMPDVFACPSESNRHRGWTRYQAVVGPKAGLGVVGTMFEEARGIDVREATDGTSNTLMAAEAAALVPWTKPEERSFQQDGPLPIFGSRHRGGFGVLFADGSARSVSFGIALQTLRAILTRDGGEVSGG